MAGFPTVNFSDSEQGLFTPDEIRRLMRIEFDRAARYQYPIVCTLIEVDRLESLHDLYGYESKEEILNAVIELLRSMTRASDFLGCMRDDRLMVLFPHTHERVARALAQRMLVGARRLRFDNDGRTLRTTLSIGISHAKPGERGGYEDFVQAAEEALQLAVEGGGDRYVERGETLRSEIDELRTEIEAQAIALQEFRTGQEPPSQPEAVASPGAPEPASGGAILEGDLPETPLGHRLRALFQIMGPQSGDTAELQREIVQLALALAAAKDATLAAQLAERDRQVDLLERRVRKLAGLLDVTEAELQRIASMKDVDAGIASVYRNVQGLSPGERNYALKKELMKEIFKANLELRQGRSQQEG